MCESRTGTGSTDIRKRKNFIINTFVQYNCAFEVPNCADLAWELRSYASLWKEAYAQQRDVEVYIEEDMTTAAADIFQTAEDLFESAMLYKFILTVKMSSSEIYPWFSDIYECVLTGTRRPSVTAATRAQPASTNKGGEGVKRIEYFKTIENEIMKKIICHNRALQNTHNIMPMFL